MRSELLKLHFSRRPWCYSSACIVISPSCGWPRFYKRDSAHLVGGGVTVGFHILCCFYLFCEVVYKPIRIWFTSMFVFWVVILCGLVGIYHRFEESHCCPEDGDSMFIRNPGQALARGGVRTRALPRVPRYFCTALTFVCTYKLKQCFPPQRRNLPTSPHGVII